MCIRDSSCGDSCGGGCGGCGGSQPQLTGRNVGKTCRTHYRGTFNDGTQSDSSYDRGEPLELSIIHISITPDAPVITNVTVSGYTIKVTYKAAANATGYDVVLGTGSKKENGETRPYPVSYTHLDVYKRQQYAYGYHGFI